jgi:hypothetical protein
VRRFAVAFAVFLGAPPCSAYTWTELGPQDTTSLNCYFHSFDTSCAILCTPSGILVRPDSQWDYYSHEGLPVWDIAPLDSSTVLLAAGDGTGSDALLSFDLDTCQFDILHACLRPHFVAYFDRDNCFYAGHEGGLLSSANGIDWEGVAYFDQEDCMALDSYAGHYVVCADNTIHVADESGTPQFGSRIDQGLIEYGPINEASGVVASRRNRDVLWTHNDSGGQSAIYAFSSNGTHLGVYRLDGTTNRDWEDIALGYNDSTDAYYIYVGDIGDNAGVFVDKYILKIEEPAVSSSQAPVDTTLYGAETITFTYPAGIRYNAETLMVDPFNNDLYVITKRGGGNPDLVFRAAYPQSTSQPIVMEQVGTLTIPVASVTVGGDISPSGVEVLTKTYASVYYWRRQPGQALWDALANMGVGVPYVQEPQGEAVCWKSNGMGYYTVSEEPGGVPAHLYHYPRESWHQAQFASLVISDFAFDPSGVLYGIFPSTSYSSGLWSSTDYGETWADEFLSMMMTSVAVDSNGVVFVGWDTSARDSAGVAVWAPGISNLAFVNSGVPGMQVNKLVQDPSAGIPAVACCTDSGAASITDYFGPAALGIRSIDTSTARLWWTVVPAATHYDVYRSPRPYFSGSGTPWMTVVAPAAHLDFAGGVGDPNLNYYFVATARNATQTSANSNTVGEFDFGL